MQENWMSCPICVEQVTEPGAIDCGHTFCYTCIEKWLKLNNACPLCKCVVTKLTGQFAAKPIRPPQVDYETKIANYLFGPQRPARVHVPYSQQPDLPGFVSHDTIDEILTNEAFDNSGYEEPMRCSLAPTDFQPVYTRTRHRRKQVK